MPEKLVVHFQPLLRRMRVHIPVFHIADDLHSVGVKPVIESRKLKRRSVYIGNIHFSFIQIHIYIRSQVLKIHFLHKFAQLYSLLCHRYYPRFLILS